MKPSSLRFALLAALLPLGLEASLTAEEVNLNSSAITGACFGVSQEVHHFYLYSITSPTGNVYIGQTRALRQRMSVYRRVDCPKQHFLRHSLQKYGWENHHLEILADGEMTQEAINQMEVDAIAEAKAANVSMNICAGGETGPAYTGKDHPASRPVLQFDLEGNLLKEWPNSTEAAKEVPGVNDSSGIHIAQRKGRHYAYGYLWVYKADYDRGVRPWHDPVKNRSLRAVVQLTLSGDFVATHRSSEAANLAMGGTRCVGQCLRGEVRHTKGFLWCYEDDYNMGKRPMTLTLEQAAVERPVLMFARNGTPLGEFPSITAAAKGSSLSSSQIGRQCAGRITRPNGVYFRYKPLV